MTDLPQSNPIPCMHLEICVLQSCYMHALGDLCQCNRQFTHAFPTPAALCVPTVHPCAAHACCSMRTDNSATRSPRLLQYAYRQFTHALPTTAAVCVPTVHPRAPHDCCSMRTDILPSERPASAGSSLDCGARETCEAIAIGTSIGSTPRPRPRLHELFCRGIK